MTTDTLQICFYKGRMSFQTFAAWTLEELRQVVIAEVYEKQKDIFSAEHEDVPAEEAIDRWTELTHNTEALVFTTVEVPEKTKSTP